MGDQAGTVNVERERPPLVVPANAWMTRHLNLHHLPRLQHRKALAWDVFFISAITGASIASSVN